MKRISSLLLATCLVLAMAAPAGAYEAFKGLLGVLQNEAGALDGYVLVCPQASKMTYLMDKDGNVVNTWTSEYNGFYAELLPNGNLARHSRMANPNPSFGGASGLIEEFDWDGNVVWTHQINEDLKEMSHHTFEVMPNGDYMILVWEYRSYEEAVAKGLDTTDPNRTLFPEGQRSGNIQIMGIWPDTIRQVNHDHETVWEFKVWDNTTAEDHADGWNINRYLTPLESRQEAGPDWTHFNGVAYNPRTNQVTCTSRAQSECYVIDYATKQVVYRWGNPANYGAGKAPAAYGDNGDQILFGPHAPDWTADNTITILDNGANRPSGPLTGFYEIDPSKQGRDAITFEWHSASTVYYSSRQSGVQKLPNNNYLLTLSTGGCMIEITPDKSIVWEFVNPVAADKIYMTSSNHGQTGDGVHRAQFYTADFPGLVGKDLTPMYSLPNWVNMLRIDPAPKGVAGR